MPQGAHPPEAVGRRGFLRLLTAGGAALTLGGVAAWLGLTREGRDVGQQVLSTLAGRDKSSNNPPAEVATQEALTPTPDSPTNTPQPTPTETATPTATATEMAGPIDPRVSIPGEVLRPGGEVLFTRGFEGGGSLIVVNNNVEHLGSLEVNMDGMEFGPNSILVESWAEAAGYPDVSSFLQAMREKTLAPKEFPEFAGNPGPLTLNLQTLVISIDPRPEGIAQKSLTLDLNAEVRRSGGWIALQPGVQQYAESHDYIRYELRDDCTIIHYATNNTNHPETAVVHGDEFFLRSLSTDIVWAVEAMTVIEQNNGNVPNGIGEIPAIVESQGVGVGELYFYRLIPPEFFFAR